MPVNITKLREAIARGVREYRDDHAFWNPLSFSGYEGKYRAIKLAELAERLDDNSVVVLAHAFFSGRGCGDELKKQVATHIRGVYTSDEYDKCYHHPEIVIGPYDQGAGMSIAIQLAQVDAARTLLATSFGRLETSVSGDAVSRIQAMLNNKGVYSVLSGPDGGVRDDVMDIFAVEMKEPAP